VSRYQLQCVTHLPVLIPDEKSDEYATFFSIGATGGSDWPKPVRVLTTKDVQKNLRKAIKQSEINLFNGILRLKRAYDEKDELELQSAYLLVWPWLENVSHGDAHNWTEEQAKQSYSEMISFKSSDHIRFDYSQLVTRVFEAARLVMWSPEKSKNFTPAVFCPDWRTAAFVIAFLGNILVCPICNRLFASTGKKIYCTTKCQNSHRQRRFRFRAEARTRRKR
jgi:hypothetical protein